MKDDRYPAGYDNNFWVLTSRPGKPFQPVRVLALDKLYKLIILCLFYLILIFKYCV
jgi:hypothetical protein